MDQVVTDEPIVALETEPRLRRRLNLTDGESAAA